MINLSSFSNTAERSAWVREHGLGPEWTVIQKHELGRLLKVLNAQTDVEHIRAQLACLADFKADTMTATQRGQQLRAELSQAKEQLAQLAEEARAVFK